MHNTAVETIIEKQRWWDILSRMIDVLQINFFVVDKSGKMILPPERSQFGGKIITDNLLNISFLSSPVDVSLEFEAFGKYYKYDAPLGLKFFAVPVYVNGTVIAYLLVGPLVIDRLIRAEEMERDVSDALTKDTIIEQVNSLRLVSHVMLNSILDLLYEIFKNTIDSTISEKCLQQEEMACLITHDQKIEAEKLYARVGADGVLITLLDVALKMTEAESGSIMILGEDGETLTIKAARGMDSQMIQRASHRLGEGVAGMAVAHNEYYYIEGCVPPNNRLVNRLKRGNIHNSLVMPLLSQGAVFGVLNLNATRGNNLKLEMNIENLKYLTRLVASAN